MNMSSPTKFLNTIESVLKDREARAARRRLTIAAPDSVDFSSNDFLSLSKREDLRAHYLTELANATSIPLSSGSSRLLDGNCSYAEELEADLAEFYRAPSGLLFSSGFDANSGFFSCVPQRGDVVIFDEFIHASVHEGMRLSRASKLITFQHNCLQDLKKCLKTLIESDSAIARGQHNVFIGVESVYSMDGDVAPIKEILEIIDAFFPESNGHLIVDEAHSSGVYGPQGRGIVCDLGVEDRILARLHTFGKALSATGAILVCHPTLRDYLINYARNFIYTTAPGIPTLALVKSVHHFMKQGWTEAAQTKLWSLIYYFYNGLQALPRTPLLCLASDPPKSCIFGLCTPDPRSLAARCQKQGFVVRAIMPPTVPKGGQRVRVCLHADNTPEQIDQLLSIIADWIRSESQEVPRQTAAPLQRSRL